MHKRLRGNRRALKRDWERGMMKKILVAALLLFGALPVMAQGTAPANQSWDVLRQLPEGVYLKSIKQTGPRVNVKTSLEESVRGYLASHDEFQAEPEIEKVELRKILDAFLNGGAA